MKKRAILFLVIIVILGCFSGCKNGKFQFGKSYESKADTINDNAGIKVIEPSIDPEQDIIKIALVVGEVESDYNDLLHKAMLKEANTIDKNIEIVRLGTQDTGDTDEQIKIVENCIDDKYDGIIISQTDTKKTADVLKKAHDKGIFVISLENDDLKENVDICLDVNEKNIGEECAKSICELLEEKGNVAVVLSDEEKEKKDGMYMGFQAEIENNHKEVSIELVETSKSDRQNGKKILEEKILKNKIKIDAIWSLDELVSLGISRALSDNEICDIMLVTCGDTNELIEEIRTGCIQATAQSKPTALGIKAVDYVVELVKGERFEQKNVKANITMIKNNEEEQ